MQYVFDILIILIIVFYIIFGKAKGFASTLVGLLKWIVAFALAAAFAAIAAGLVYDSFIADGMNERVSDLIGEHETLSYTQARELFEKLGISTDTDDDSLLVQIDSEVESGKSLSEAITFVVVRPTQIRIITPMCFTIIFLISFIICGILEKVLKLINKIPLLGQINESFGAVLGGVQGIIVAAITCCVLVALARVIDASFFNIDILNKTIIVKNVTEFVLNSVM